MIIGFAGKKRSGKDTIANYLVNKYNFRRYAFGDPVKEVCRILFGFDDEQLYGDRKEELDGIGITPREAFQGIGTEFGRKYLHELFPTLRVERGGLWMDIFRRNCGGGDVVVSDVRFGNEADLIREMGGCVIYLDSGYGVEDGHETERVDLSYDYVLENRGTLEDFYENFESLYLKTGV